MKGILPVIDNDPEGTLRRLFAQWLSDNRLAAILAPAYSATGCATMALVSDPAHITETAPLLPAMAVNAASIVADIATKSANQADVKVGLFLRPCELRAVVELIKLRQILLDNIVLVGVDCPGTYRASVFADIRGADTDLNTRHVREQSEYARNANFRTSCQLCEFPKPLVFDLAIGYIGMDPDSELWVEAATEKGTALLASIEINPTEEPASRRNALADLVRQRQTAVAARIAELERVVMGPENLVRYFASCINCHNCMRVCPVCYCRECFFDSATFERDLSEHIRISLRKGLTRMPSETLLFHLTRMNHMMTSCVQCGICEDACPASIGLATLFKKVSHNAQQEFGYLSGRSLDEPLPLVTFREDEFRKLGEE